MPFQVFESKKNLMLESASTGMKKRPFYSYPYSPKSSLRENLIIKSGIYNRRIHSAGVHSANI